MFSDAEVRRSFEAVEAVVGNHLQLLTFEHLLHSIRYGLTFGTAGGAAAVCGDCLPCARRRAVFLVDFASV